MSLIILLSAGDESRAALWYDTASGESGEDTALATLRARAEGRELCVAVPGEDALSRTLNLPMKRRRDLVRAADLVIEDQLAAPMPDRKIAFGPAGAGGRLVTAIPGAVVGDTLSRLADEGLDPDILTTDHALLPVPEEDSVVLLPLGGRLAVRTVGGAFTAEEGFAEAILAGDGGVTRRVVTAADLTPPTEAPNFRTGALAKRQPLPDLKPYAVAAGLLLASGAVFLAASFVEASRYAAAASELENTAESAFLEVNPGTPVFDLERQLRTAGRGRAQSDFLPLAAILTEVLEDQEDTSLSTLDYEDNGQLTAELTFTSFSDLETVTGALSERGIIAEEGGDARREDGAFVTRLFLRAA